MLIAADWISIFYLALAIQGEGAGLMGPHRNAAAMAIGDVVMNRYDRMRAIEDPRRRWWGSTVREIVTGGNGFYGWTNVRGQPVEWAVEAAVDRYYRRASSIPRGVYFVLSAEDLRTSASIQTMSGSCGGSSGRAGDCISFGNGRGRRG